MPQLPIAESTRQVDSSGSMPKVSEESAGATGRALQQVGQAVSTTTDFWAKALATTQYTTAKNNTLIATNDILDRAEKDPDYNNQDKYIAELEKTTKQDPQILDSGLRGQYDADKNLLKSNAKIKLNDVFWKKRIQHQETELQKAHDSSKDAYMLAVSPEERMQVKAGYEDIINKSFESGYIDEGAKYKLIESLDTWNNELAIRAGSKNPSEVIKNLDKFGVKDEDRVKVIAAIRSAAAVEQSLFEIAQEEKYNANQNYGIELITPDADYVSLKGQFQSWLLQDKIDKNTYDTLERQLDSTQRLNATTYDEDFAQFERVISDLNESKKFKKKTAKEYLSRVRDVKNAIANSNSNGRLTAQDAGLLLKAADKAAQTEARKASKAIEKDNSWGQWGFTNKQANAYFENQFKGNKAFANEAIREYFYRTYDLGKTAKERAQVAEDVAKELKGKIVAQSGIDPNLKKQALAKYSQAQISEGAKNRKMTEGQFLTWLEQKGMLNE